MKSYRLLKKIDLARIKGVIRACHEREGTKTTLVNMTEIKLCERE